MALPTSGQLALSQIRDEFGAGTTSNVSLRTLSAAANLSIPDGFNEFYGLSAYTPPSYITGANSISGSGTAASPYNIAPTLGATSWAGYNQTYFSYVYNQWFDIYDTYVQSATSKYMVGLQFKNNFSGTQRAKVKFISSNVNFNSQGYTGFSFYGSGIDHSPQNCCANVWPSQVNLIKTGSNFTTPVNSTLTFGGGFTQWSAEGTASAEDPFNDYAWELSFHIPSANYPLSVSSYNIQLWFEPV